MQEQNFAHIQSGVAQVRRWVFSSHFLAKLFFGRGEFAYEDVMTWRQERALKDTSQQWFETYGSLQSLDQVIVPVHYTEQHWVRSSVACTRVVHPFCMYVCMYDYIAVSTRTLTPPTTGNV